MNLLLLTAIFLGQAAQAETGVLAGVLRTSDGKPAVDVRVAVMAAPESGSRVVATATLFSITKTDQSGRYRLESVPPGRYVIVAGQSDAQTFYPGTADARAATIFTIARGSIVGELNFTVPEQRAPFKTSSGDIAITASAASGARRVPDSDSRIQQVLGSVVSETGGVILNLPGAIVITASPGADAVSAIVEADGTFRFNLPVGEHRIAVSTPAGYSVKSMNAGATDLFLLPLRIEPSGASAAVEIRLATPSVERISGVVVEAGTGKPIPGAAITLIDPGRIRFNTRAAADGSFEFVGASQGDYAVAVSLTGYQTLDLTFAAPDGGMNIDFVLRPRVNP